MVEEEDGIDVRRDGRCDWACAVYCDAGNLVLVLGAGGDDEERLVRDLDALQVRPLPRFLTGECGVNDRSVTTTTTTPPPLPSLSFWSTLTGGALYRCDDSLCDTDGVIHDEGCYTSATCER